MAFLRSKKKGGKKKEEVKESVQTKGENLMEELIRLSN